MPSGTESSSARARRLYFALRFRLAIGETAGGPIVGAIGRAFSLPAALVASALFYVPLLGLYGRAARHPGREPELVDLPEPIQTGA